MGARQKRRQRFPNGFRCLVLAFLLVVGFCGFVNAAEKHINVKAKSRFEEQGSFNQKPDKSKFVTPRFDIDREIDNIMNAFATPFLEVVSPQFELPRMHTSRPNYTSPPSQPSGFGQDHVNPNENSSQGDNDDSNLNPAESASIMLAIAMRGYFPPDDLPPQGVEGGLSQEPAFPPAVPDLPGQAVVNHFYKEEKVDLIAAEFGKIVSAEVMSKQVMKEIEKQAVGFKEMKEIETTYASEIAELKKAEMIEKVSEKVIEPPKVESPKVEVPITKDEGEKKEVKK